MKMGFLIVILAAGLFALPVRAEQGDFRDIDQMYLHRDEPGKMDDMMAQLNARIQQNPKDLESLWRRGRAYRALGDQQNWLLGHREKYDQATKDRMKAAMMDDYERAKKDLQTAVDGNIQEPEPHFQLGVVLGRIGEQQNILAHIFGGARSLIHHIESEMRKAIELAPGHDYGRAHRVLGEMYFDVAPWKIFGHSRAEAVSEMKKAIELDPNHLSNLISLADMELKMGNLKDAKDLLDRAKRISEPDDPGERAEDQEDIQNLDRRLAASKH